MKFTPSPASPRFVSSEKKTRRLAGTIEEKKVRCSRFIRALCVMDGICRKQTGGESENIVIHVMRWGALIGVVLALPGLLSGGVDIGGGV